MTRKSLNPRQLEVLRWIADGCPDGVMSDFTYKTSAVALRNRGLATVSKRGGWHAEITEDGRHYLEHAGYPGEVPRPKASRSQTAVRRGHGTTADGAKSQVAGEAAEAIKAEGTSSVVGGRPEPADVDVPVSAHLRNPHPAVAALRDDRMRFGLTDLVRSRALRVLQALVVAAEREGYRVREVRSTRNGYGYARPESRDHLVIETGEASVKVRMFQQNDRSPHQPTTRELDEQKRWGHSPTQYDHTPNASLRVELDNNWNGRRHVWRDGKRGSIEGKLSAVLGEVAHRHADAQEDRIKAEQAAVERERQQQIAIEAAKVLLRESHRAEVLERQATDWRRSGDLREYASAMTEVTESMTDPDEKRAAGEWVSWAKAHADELDPLTGKLHMPDDPEPTAEALRPFLRW